jgi:hypothetical protein
MSSTATLSLLLSTQLTKKTNRYLQPHNYPWSMTNAFTTLNSQPKRQLLDGKALKKDSSSADS